MKITIGELRRMIVEEVGSIDEVPAEYADGDVIEDGAEEEVDETAPPGWKGTVRAMKKHQDIDNPFALAWSMKKRGAHPHRASHG